MYTLSVYLFGFLVRLAGWFGNTKAKQLARGQKNVWSQIKTKLQPGERRIWIHCASVGEFEQGRPLMEEIRDKFPQYKIVVTFFSPSGYELRKDYAGANYVFYLPYDTRRNAKRFIWEINPEKIYFIKYEFWRNYLHSIKQQQISLYLVSAYFRPDQIFFKWYGGWYRKQLKAFTHFFVQNDRSRELLTQIGIQRVTVTGDTRFDRVCRIADQARVIPDVESFVNGYACIIAGSTWPADEKLLVQYADTKNRNVKWIFAPHEIHENRIDRLMSSFKMNAVRYSRLSEVNPVDCQVLVIDNIGMLASLYRYGTIAYIGGGFGDGIHNTLEAAVYGIPVLFGPAYKEFGEAVDMTEQGAAFSVKNYTELARQLDLLLDHPDKLKQAGNIAGAYVASGRGATEKVLQESMNE